MATPFQVGAVRGWAHDEGHPAGTFRTFDALDLRWPDGSPYTRARKVHVFVPRAPRPPGGFPVTVVHDGDTAFWPGGVANATWDLAGVSSRTPAPPRVLVALHPVDRDREYTHAPWLRGAPWGGLPTYARWLAEVVVPWVRSWLPLDPRPAATSVLGSSHGGLASFWAATRHPDVFGEAVCMSTSLFTGLDSLRSDARGGPLADAPLVRDVAPLLSDPGRRPRLWLDWGLRRDGGEHNSVVERLATERGRELAAWLVDRCGYVEGVDLTTVEHAAAGHDETAWSERFGWWLARTAPNDATRRTP